MENEFDEMMQNIEKQNPIISNIKTPWAVHCRTHGQVFLTHEEYNRQMRNINSLWKCPICGRKSQWDDENYESFIEADEQAAEDAAHQAELEDEIGYYEQQRLKSEDEAKQAEEAEAQARYEQKCQEDFDPGYDGSGEY